MLKLATINGVAVAEIPLGNAGGESRYRVFTFDPFDDGSHAIRESYGTLQEAQARYSALYNEAEKDAAKYGFERDYGIGLERVQRIHYSPGRNED